MPRAHRKRTKSVKRTKVRVVKGRLSLKVAGYPGLHRFGASQLIQFVPLNTIKVAAKIFYCNPGPRRLSKKGQQNKNREKTKEINIHA